ncbi:hypothetical protein [uncultured Desulfovibrio sp.]|uniref:hypothetical protein n=1 Tax=uncultured Desulfovibrio sp. TaxID=167968 RepID=UPI0028041E9E|nr:hypothetical protein [uncultured Desulfovibrio sp.]
MGNPDKLEGWAQIESYLNLSRKTIIARGYPIRKGGGVFAFKNELDAHGKGKSFLSHSLKFPKSPSFSQSFP